MFSRMLSHGGAVYVAVYVPANSSGHIGFLRKLAVKAVISELVSVSPFPCFAGKYREIRRIQTEDDD
jgi:hypothetical protein